MARKADADQRRAWLLDTTIDGESALAKVRRGLPYSVVEALADAIGSRQELAQAVGIPRARWCGGSGPVA